MNEAIEKLGNCLERKRFLPIECEGMTQDIADFIRNRGHPSITALNQEMEVLGWGIGVIDDELYALAIPLGGNISRTKTWIRNLYRKEGVKWATREKEIRANEKNRKRASTH